MEKELNREKYESVIVFHPTLEEAALNAEISKIDDVIKAHSGSITKQDIWGKRQLAYKISKQEYGVYVCLVYEAKTSIITELDRYLRINESVLRFLNVKKDKFAPDFLATRARLLDSEVDGLDPLPEEDFGVPLDA